MQTNEIQKYREWKRAHPSYPLTVHPRGQWAKKVRGRVHYFGALSDPDAALKRWLMKKEQLRAGIRPSTGTQDVSPSDKPLQCSEFRQLVEKLDALCQKADALFVHYGRAARGPQVYTVEEVAEILCITKRAVTNLLARGPLAYIDVSAVHPSRKKTKRIRKDDLLAFLDLSRVIPPEYGLTRASRRLEYVRALTAKGARKLL